MSTLYQQPQAHRFGNALKENLQSGEWTSFEAAVAWVRRSGMRHLEDALGGFLASGGDVKLTVGIDLRSTSYEGLEDLLSLRQRGTIDVAVYHNEAASVFHPKLYLFR